MVRILYMYHIPYRSGFLKDAARLLLSGANAFSPFVEETAFRKPVGFAYIRA